MSRSAQPTWHRVSSTPRLFTVASQSLPSQSSFVLTPNSPANRPQCWTVTDDCSVASRATMTKREVSSHYERAASTVDESAKPVSSQHAARKRDPSTPSAPTTSLGSCWCRHLGNWRLRSAQAIPSRAGEDHDRSNRPQESLPTVAESGSTEASSCLSSGYRWDVDSRGPSRPGPKRGVHHADASS